MDNSAVLQEHALDGSSNTVAGANRFRHEVM
jgi:hypothetical protein